MFTNLRKRRKLRRLAIIGLMLELEDEKKCKRMWVHPINQKREEFGEFHHLIQELKLYPPRFYTYFRMDLEHFMYLLHELEPHITAKICNFRKRLSSEQKVAVCLRYAPYFSLFETITARALSSGFHFGRHFLLLNYTRCYVFFNKFHYKNEERIQNTGC